MSLLFWGMGPFLTQRGLGRGLTQCQVEWYPNPSNRLATIHQRYRHRQTQRQTTVRLHGANLFTNGRDALKKLNCWKSSGKRVPVPHRC